jgi:hypothetical protein
LAGVRSAWLGQRNHCVRGHGVPCVGFCSLRDTLLQHSPERPNKGLVVQEISGQAMGACDFDLVDGLQLCGNLCFRSFSPVEKPRSAQICCALALVRNSVTLCRLDERGEWRKKRLFMEDGMLLSPFLVRGCAILLNVNLHFSYICIMNESSVGFL